jgi:PIN domain nuclease of toxin-antitoxin system
VRVILDTCAAIWLMQDARLSAEASDAIQRAAANGGVFVSPITAWEIGQLVARGRLALTTAPNAWFQRLLEAPSLRLAEMTPDMLIASSFLPGSPPRDPADRIIAATARAADLSIVTRDRPLLAYAEEGHLKAIAC